MRLQIEARRSDLKSVGVIPRRSFDAVIRFNDVSTWTLGVRRQDLEQGGGFLQGAFLEGGGIVVRDLDNPTGDPILSGPWTGDDEEWTATDSGVITLSGVSDMIHVQDRVALPVPSGAISQAGQSARSNDVRTGPAGNVIRGYVRDAFGAFSQLGWTTQPDTSPAEGTTVTGSARYTQLLELIQPLAVAGGDVGFRVVQRGTALVFEVYVPSFRENVLLSRQTGTLVGGKTTQNAPTVTHVIVLQQGEGTDRQVDYVFTTESSAQSLSWRRRIIQVVDRRDTDDTSAGQTAALDTLASGGASGTIEADVQDTDRVRFGRDYTVGDRVKYQPWWLPLTATPLVDVVREVKLTQPDGSSVVSVKAAVGPPGTNTASTTQYARLRGVEASVRKLGNV